MSNFKEIYILKNLLLLLLFVAVNEDWLTTGVDIRRIAVLAFMY